MTLGKSDVPDKPNYRTGKTLGELMQKKENPIKGLIRSGVAIKMLVGDNSKLNTIMQEVEKQNKEFTKGNDAASALDTRKVDDLENLRGMLTSKQLLI